MRTVGAFAARTHFSALLEQVAQGTEITITRHGKAVARMVPVDAPADDRLERKVARLKTFRRGRRLGNQWSVKSLIEEERQ
jgi:prevent-host-death family protein